MTQQHDSADVLIVGGGMVGLSLAALLGQAGLKVTVLEHSEISRFDPQADYALRVSALSLASCDLLDKLGAWAGIATERHCAYQEMFVWDAAGDGEIHFDSATIQAEQLGYIVENKLIQTALLDTVVKLDNVELLSPVNICEFKQRLDSVAVLLDDGRCLQASLLVGADGAQSAVRQWANISTREWDYLQCGVVAVVKAEQSHQCTAWQRFLSNGPLALLPLDDGRCSIVWSTTPAHADELLALSEQAFCAAVAEASAYKLGNIVAASPAAAFPLRYLHADRYTQSRVALIGDAAHVVHPLAGQGVNLGLADAAALAQSIIQAQQARRDLGGISMLRRYERARKGENYAMSLALDGIKRLFSNDAPYLVGARNIGLSIANNNPLIKHFFMRQAMGKR